MKIELEIPVGIDAEIVIPAGFRKYLIEGEKHIKQMKGIPY